MKKFSLLFLLAVSFFQLKAQDNKEKQQLKSITLQAYESVSQPTRQWFADASEKHPVGDFDTAYAIHKLKEKFTAAQLTNTSDILTCMLAYQQMANKEAREDRKVQTLLKQRMLASKVEKLRLDNEKIDLGMKEAAEKADIAMSAATTGLIIGIVNGGIQIAAASIASLGNQNTSPKDSSKTKTKSTPISQQEKSANKLSLSLYIKKLEAQLAILKKVEI